MRSFKLIITIVACVAGVIALGFFGFWLYNRHLSNNYPNLDSNNPESNFFMAAKGQLQIYPTRNWKISDPDVKAQIFSVSDIDNDFIYLEKNPNSRRPIASLTKLMTSLVAEKNIAPTSEVTITDNALSTDGDKGYGLIANEIFNSRDLIKLMLLVSSNKAAYALADTVGYDDFIRLMNEEAKNLNMTQTSFNDSSGLSMLNQSTAEDLKRLTRYIVKEYPAIFIATQEQNATIFSVDNKVKHVLTNIDQISLEPKFLKELGIKYLGGKTGFTDEAKETFLGLFSIPNTKDPGQSKRILVIVLSSDSRYNDVESLLRWLKSAYVF